MSKYVVICLCRSHLLQAVVQQRVAIEQQRHKIFEARERRRKVARTRSAHPHVTEAEALCAIADCNNREDDAIIKLGQYDYLCQIRLQVAKGENEDGQEKRKKRNGDDEAYEESSHSEASDESSDEDDWEAERSGAARKHHSKKSSDNTGRTAEGSYVLLVDITQSNNKQYIQEIPPEAQRCNCSRRSFWLVTSSYSSMAIERQES